MPTCRVPRPRFRASSQSKMPSKARRSLLDDLEGVNDDVDLHFNVDYAFRSSSLIRACTTPHQKAYLSNTSHNHTQHVCSNSSLHGFVYSMQTCNLSRHSAFTAMSKCMSVCFWQPPTSYPPFNSAVKSAKLYLQPVLCCFEC